MELKRKMDRIGSKILSKELQDLKMNNLVSRTIVNTKPISVEHDLTDYGKTLEPVIHAIAKWGIHYRETVLIK